MKTKIIKAISLVLSLIMTVGVLISCGKKYQAVFTYNGHEITEDMYYYWASTYKRNLLNGYKDAKNTPEFWNTELDDGKTIEEKYSESINIHIMNYAVTDSLFREYKLSLKDSAISDIEEDINEKIDYYGGKKELNKELEEILIDVDKLKKCYEIEAKYGTLCDYLFGENGELKPTDEEITEYYGNNYSHIKYIVFFTQKIEEDENGNYETDSEGNYVASELTEEEKAELDKKIDECFDKVKNGEDFDQLAQTYSQYDTSQYTNGFFVSENEVSIWESDIVSACKDANIGDTFKVIEGGAVYIIEKLPLTDFDEMNDFDLEQLEKLSIYAADKKADEFFTEKRKDVIINEELLEKYKLSEIKANPYYSF